MSGGCQDGTTPVLIAAMHGHVEVVDRLIASRCNVDKARKSETGALVGQAGITPLLIAADRGHMDEVDRLIAAGGDVKASDSNIRDPFSVLAFGFGNQGVSLDSRGCAEGREDEQRPEAARTPHEQNSSSQPPSKPDPLTNPFLLVRCKHHGVVERVSGSEERLSRGTRESPREGLGPFSCFVFNPTTRLPALPLLLPPRRAVGARARAPRACPLQKATSAAARLAYSAPAPPASPPRPTTCAHAQSEPEEDKEVEREEDEEERGIERHDEEEGQRRRGEERTEGWDRRVFKT
eukprot:1443707-Rhodomonas_salina.1